MKQIQWFPGHMQKARKQIEQKLPVVDIVYELTDARIPDSSRNPLLIEIIKDKPHLMILNKSDLADPIETDKWLKEYEKLGLKAVAVNSLTGTVFNEINKVTQEILEPLREKEAAKGMKQRPFRAMVIGIPNVGKSQFINNMAGKNKVKTGNLPGVTKNQSFIKTKGNILLFDNPGVLWPKFDNATVGNNLALLGAIKDDILPLDDVAIYGIDFLLKHYPARFIERYNFEPNELMTAVEIMDQIGERRGCKLSGGLIDYDRVINLFLYDIRNFKLGRLTLETVEDVEVRNRSLE